MYFIEDLGDVGKHLSCAAVLQYQLAMGARRVNDTSKLSKNNVKHNSDSSLDDKLSLLAKLCRSKNIQEGNQGMSVVVCLFPIITVHVIV